jgi:hypothetical protein
MNLINPYTIIGGAVLLFIVLIFLIFGLEPLTRMIIKSSGIPARAKILEKKFGKWVMYSGGEYNQNVTGQQLVLKLEVHPQNEMPYICEDKFMAKPVDLMRLNEGCELQVMISKSNPQKVVCLPDTATAPEGASSQTRAGAALADIVEQAIHGEVPTTDQVLDALKSQGFQTTSFTTTNFSALTPDQQHKVEEALKMAGQNPGMAQVLRTQGMKTSVVTNVSDPKDTLEKLKEMLDSGLISQSEYDQKKKEILERM